MLKRKTRIAVNYSKIIIDYSCVFLIIHVEKKKVMVINC